MTVSANLFLAECNMSHHQLRIIKRAMKTDFPTNERIPFPLLKRALRKEIMQAFFLTDGIQPYGYAIVQPLPEKRMVYVHYLAVLPHVRAKGYGSLLLSLLTKKFQPSILVLEVEKPVRQLGKQRDVQEKRIRFYEKNHLMVVPGIELSLFQVDMLIMATDMPSVEDWGHFILSIYAKITGMRMPKRLMQVKEADAG